MYPRICLLICCFCALTGKAQDIISKKNGEKIEARILNVDNAEVRYRQSNDSVGRIYSILRSYVYTIQYEHGSLDTLKEVFAPGVMHNPNQNGLTDPYLAGVKDAEKYYVRYKNARNGTLVASVLSPAIGLIPAIACSFTQPKQYNLGFPNPESMDNAAYARGYVGQAKRIKQSKVWTSWGIGLGTNIILGIIILSHKR